MKRGIVAAGFLLAAAQTAWAAGTDWTSYGQDPGGQRFSPLAQITPANVAGLKPVWTYHMNPAFDPKVRNPAFVSQTTPLEVKGVLYFTTPYERVVALEATTGKQIWAYQLPKGDNPSWRGLVYWPGNGKDGARLLFGTVRGRLVALSARTGEPVDGFGDHGMVDLKTPEIMNGMARAPYGLTAPPALYKNLVILGSRVQEGSPKGPAGDVRAFDVRTGKLAWTFKSIPAPGQKGSETWEGDSTAQRTGVNVWNVMTVDTSRGIVFLPFSAPTYDRYGGDRPGTNLYSSSLVAVDAASGKYLWHFQVTHHDIWDYDLHTPPTLITVKKDGKTIPAVVAMNKTGLMFMLNRVTGEPIYKVTEKPVPPSTVAGEKAWPTQPFPEKPVQLTRSSFALNEVADLTPELKANCQAMIDSRKIKGSATYEPIPSDVPMARFPGAEGGPEWGGGAFDPRLGYFIVNTNNTGYVERLVKGANGEWSVEGGRFIDPKTNMLCQQTPWGNLTAVNVNTGDIAWRVTLGVSDQAPDGKKDTGRPSNGGPIVTAGGITFVGGTDDARFRAFDSRTGKELWTWKLDYAAHATPMTFLGKDGRQYVGIAATGGSYLQSPPGGDALVMFALPKK